MSSKSKRRKHLRLGFGLLLVPFSLWCLALSFAPTDWARTRIQDALKQATGQPVQLESVSLRLFGGVSLTGLTLGDPQVTDGPWLKADQIQVNVSLVHLLKGQVKATHGRASGVTLRVHRYADGSFEFGDLLTRDPQPATASVSHDSEDVPLDIEIDNARLLVLDEPTSTSLDLTDVSASGSWSRDRAEITRLDGQLQGGQLRLAVRMDRGNRTPVFDGEIRLQNVGLTQNVGALSFLVPALAGRAESLSGRINLDVRAQARCSSTLQFRRTLSGEGTVAVTELAIGSSELLTEVCQALRMPAQDRYASLSGGFLIGNQRVATRNLSLRIDPLPTPISLVGWTDFAGRLDYLIRVDALTSRLGDLASRLSAEAQPYLADLPQALSEVAELRVRGTTQNLEVSANGARLEEWADKFKERHPDDVDALRELGRHLRNRVLR